MANAYFTGRTDTRPVMAGILRWGVTLMNSVRDWNDARATRAALETLSDHELEDIGLHRGDIDRIAEGHR